MSGKLRQQASTDMHFFQPEQVKQAFTILATAGGMSLKHVETFTKALGTDVHVPKPLIAMRVLSESLATPPTDIRQAAQWTEDNRAQWNVLHDTVFNVMDTWRMSIATEAQLIEEMLYKHAGPMCRSFSEAPSPNAARDASFRKIFQPFQDVTELRQFANTCKKGKTGRLTTVDEICALGDEELIPMLAITELIFAGEAPDILKMGDIVPLPKDLKRARPITCLDALFKIVDKAVGTRLMEVCQEYGLIPANAFGFIPGGSCDWPIECVSSVQRHARNEDNTAFMFFLDATSAYDTVSHRGISMACKSFAVPADVESLLLAHLGGHSRVVNTAYCLGEEDTKITLEGGLAQGANSSPALFIFATAPAHRYADSMLPGYNMPVTRQHPQGLPTDQQDAPLTYRLGLVNYADDDAGVNGGHASTLEQAKTFLEQTNAGAEALTISLAVVGVCTNHGKSLLQCSPKAHEFIPSPVLWLTALSADGVLLREQATTLEPAAWGEVQGHDAEETSTRYLGAWFDMAAPRGCYAWVKQRAKLRGIADGFRRIVTSVDPSFRLTSNVSLTIMYQRMKYMLCAEPPDQPTMTHLRNSVGHAGLQALKLPALSSLEKHQILTDILLTPVHLGGAGMEDPRRRLAQDAATNILTGLNHPSSIVRETFHTVLGESSYFAGLDGKGSRLDYCRHTAEIQLHKGPQRPPPLICYDTFQPSQRHLSRPLPPKLEELRSETTAPGRATHRHPPCTVRDPPIASPEDSVKHTALQYNPSEAAARAQALLNHPDIVWMGLNSTQESNWTTNKRVYPKGQNQYSIFESVRSTRHDDCHFHVSRDRTTAMRYAHGQGNTESRGVVMIDLRAVRQTAGAEVIDLSTDEGRRLHLGANGPASIWSQRDFELIISIQELVGTTHILGYFDMAPLRLPPRLLNCDETLVLADWNELHIHNVQSAQLFDGWIQKYKDVHET